MNRKEFNVHVSEVFDRASQVLIKKNNEYANEVNVFHNFDNATGISLHKENTSVAWEFLVKHLQSIKDILGEIEIKNLKRINQALIDEKFADAINYLILIEAMIKEKIIERDSKNTPA